MTDEVNVTEIPQMMKNIFDPVAAQKNLLFEVQTQADVPSVIMTDGKRLQQILKNLLSNAFKFTEQGSVTVRIALADSEKVEELLWFTRRGASPSDICNRYGNWNSTR